MPTRATKFYNRNLLETWQKENTPILRTYTANHEHGKKKLTLQIKTKLEQER
jgi:hypothetical protein